MCTFAIWDQLFDCVLLSLSIQLVGVSVGGVVLLCVFCLGVEPDHTLLLPVEGVTLN